MYVHFLFIDNKHLIKPKWQSRMDNPETLATVGTQYTGRRTKHRTKYKTQKHNTTQKTKKMSDTK